MLSILLGPNFSGRSEWLARRRAQRLWPKTGLLGPMADTAYTGLASTVREELAVAAVGRPGGADLHADMVTRLGLSDLLDHKIHGLSGGETVRTALASAAMQGIDELQVDTSLEQLDEQWRARVLTMLGKEHSHFSEDLFIVDNHMSPEEAASLGKTLRFPLADEQVHSFVPRLESANAAEYVGIVSPPRISVDGVTFAYSRWGENVLEKVTLDLEPGELYFLIGPNGSGKTTFVKILSGTVLPRRGSIYYGASLFRPGRSIRRFASLSFQNPDFQWTSQTAVAEFGHTRSHADKEELKHVLAKFGIPSNLLADSPNELPFVVKKRLSIALAALSGKPWYILDEPTLGQDYDYRVALADFVKRILQIGAGVIIISHDSFFRSLFEEAHHLGFHDRMITPIGY